MRRVVSLYLPTWPTDRIRRRREQDRSVPALPRDKPLVTAARSGSRRVIACADEAARRLGLQAGQTISHAQALVPDLAVVEADTAADETGLRNLAVWCTGYSPIVALDAPDGLFIEIAGSAHLFGGEAALLEDLVSRLDGRGIAVRAAVADTPGAAWALARCGGEAIAPPGATAAAVAGLPVGALRIPDETAASLDRLGIRTIGEAAALPRASLVKRFGAALARRLDQALGEVPEPLAPLIPPEVITRRAVFAEPIGDADDLRRVIAHLAAELCPDLRQAGLGARRVDLLFHRVDRTTQALTAQMARATREPAHIGRLLADDLDTLDPGFGIEEAVMVATRVEPLSEQQMQARALQGEDEERELDALVDRLTARLGRDRVFRVVPVESDIPERSLARVPPLTPPQGLSWPKGLARPGILIDPPEPVTALAVAPDHAPSVFEWRKVRHRVRRADGPERVHGEWWASSAEASAVRDYYQIENQDGRRFWLFRDGPAGQGGRWWLHGFFG
jgi:protein ImuB